MGMLVGQFLAGLALFFFGVAGIRSNLQQLTGRKFRRLLTRGTGHGVLAAAWGVVLGAITQSATAVSFILAGLIAGGTLTVPRALMIVGWANVGTAVLVFLATVDFQLAVLYVLGVTGLAVAFEIAPRLEAGFAAAFSAALLLFGLSLMKEAFAPLPGFDWFQAASEFVRGSEMAAAAFGMLLRTVIQSSSAIAVLAVVLSHAGLLTEPQMVMMIFGSAIGVGLSSFLLSSELKGVPRQIVLFHGGVNSVSGLVCMGLALVERVTGWPLVLSWVAAVPGGLGTRLSFAYLFLMVGAGTAAVLSARRAPAWLNRWSPPTIEQGLSQPRYLQEEAVHDPETALELLEREELELLAGATAHLEAARLARAGSDVALPPAVIHRAFATIARTAQEYGTTLADQQLSRAASLRLLALERRLGLLEALNDNLRDFAVGAAGHRGTGAIGALIDNLIEATDTVLLTAVDGWKTRDADDLATLTAMTEDRGTLMERIRRRASGEHDGVAPEDEAALFHLTSLFERIIWLLRQIGVSLREGDGQA